MSEEQNPRRKAINSAHACSEIGLKYLLFALHDLETASGFMSVLHFFGDFVFLEHRRNKQTGLKPFLTILGTRMRANLHLWLNI